MLSAGAADNTWPGGLTDAANRYDSTYGDDQMVCAVYGLVSTLYSWGLSWPGMPIEAYNEPGYGPDPGNPDTTDATADHLLWYQFTSPNVEPYCQQSNPPQSSGCDSPAGSGSGNYQACQSGNSQACATEPASDPKASPDQFDSALIDSSPGDLSQDGYASQDASYCILYNQVSTQSAFDNCVSKDQGH